MKTRQSGNKWENLHPEVKKKCNAHLALALQQGLQVIFWDGWRNKEAQEAEILKGSSKLTDWKNGYHPWGLAYDLVFNIGTSFTPIPSWDEKHDWKKLREIGLSLGASVISWDKPHFQYPDIIGTPKELIAKYGEPNKVIA